MEKEICIICKSKESEYTFDYLEVQTLHIRDLGGEKRVQALGEMGSVSVCKACVAKRLGEIENQIFPVKRLAPFIGIFLMGVFLCAFGLGRDTVFLLMGAAAVACGIMGCYARLKVAKVKRREYSALSNEDTLEAAAWDVLNESLPKKDGDNDLTYIPITEKTLEPKNGDLMIVYDLLPAIAKKAWDIIHGEKLEVNDGDN